MEIFGLIMAVVFGAFACGFFGSLGRIAAYRVWEAVEYRAYNTPPLAPPIEEEK